MQADDRSGGLTQTEVADISTTSPIDGETIYGRFTARAQASFVGPDNEDIPSGYPVALTIVRAKASKPAVEVGDVNTASGTPIKSLKPGTYYAIWTWHDFNGDSHTIVTSFVEEPPSGSKPSVSATAARVDNCPLARSTNVCDMGYELLHRRDVIENVGAGPLQPGSRGQLSFTPNLSLVFPALRRFDAARTALGFEERRA
jgi:hypothetical protein